MHRLFYTHPGTWFGDCMPIFADGAFQLFHQRDTRRPGPFGEPFGWALARTTDFVRFEDLGEPLERGGDDAQDQFAFAGSVLQADGRFHAFYTGYNRDFAAAGRAAQVLMHAVSDDLMTWQRSDRPLVVPQPGFDPDNWRDPFVLRDERDERWLMILGARHEDDPLVTSGRTVWLTSTDLDRWDFRGDFWAPDLYTMHEMPDLFRMDGRWYLLTTEYSDRSTTVYRSSPSLEGPWTAPVDDAFDGRPYYAARSTSDGEHRYLFGWVATKEGEQDLGGWQWGGTLVVHEVYPRPDHSLGVRLPATVRAAFGEPAAWVDRPTMIAGDDGRGRLELGTVPAADLPFLLTLRFSTSGSRAIAVRLFEDERGDAYAYVLRPGEQRLEFDRVPNYPWFRYDNRGLQRPVIIEPDREYQLDVVVDDTIAVLYLDGVALCARMYAKPGSTISLDVVDGSLTLQSASLATLGTSLGMDSPAP